MTPPVDLLAFGPHPDDVEISCGGLVAKLVSLGYRVGIVDLTRGETGTRGTPETRLEEAAAAAKVLGVAFRENLELPDGHLAVTDAMKRPIIEAIRRHRPRILLGPFPADTHPDHVATGKLLDEVLFLSGLVNYDAAGAPHRPQQTWSYMCHDPIDPSFLVDVSDAFATKMQALRCFASQLHDPTSDEPETNLASEDYLARLEARFRYFGSLIGARYAEPFHTRRPVRIDDPLAPWVGEAGERNHWA